jgi:hypothetical protein
LAALQAALNNRLTFIGTRVSQLSTVLGSIVQDVSTGAITSSSGLYGQRYSFINLRLNTLGGSLTQLAQLNGASVAQDGIKTTLIDTKNIYESVLRASKFGAPANGTPIVHLVDTSFLSAGDTVYVASQGQEELLRAVKSVNGNAVTLNDIVPQKYRTTDNARLYKVLV